MNKLKIGISIDPTLLDRVDVIASNREQSRSNTIERAVEIGLEEMEKIDRQMENPIMRAAMVHLSKPKFLETVAAMVGEDLKAYLGMEAAEAHKAILKNAERGKKRQAEKRTASDGRRLKGA